MPIDLEALPRQLRYWTIHCSLNALPSFVIACKVLEMWRQPIAIAAMLSAVATFIVGYTLVTSLRGPLSDSSHILSRSVRVGTKIRMTISIISVPLGFSDAIGILPDFWCGFFAVQLTNVILPYVGYSSGLIDLNGNNAIQKSFLPVYTSTMIEGLVLSFGLLMISFFALIALQIRDRRKIYAPAQPQQ